MSTPQQGTQGAQEPKEPLVQITEPPKPQQPTTYQPPLIPDENATAYCLTRRNVIDAIIAILLAAGIIYLVMSWRSAKPYTGLTRMRAAPSPIRLAPQAIAQRITGGFKKFFKIFRF